MTPLKEKLKKGRGSGTYLERDVDRVGNWYRLCVLDLNGCSRDKLRAGITSRFGVPRENDNGRRVIDLRAERVCISTPRCGCNEHHFGRKMNQDVDGNRKLLWKEVSKINGAKSGEL